VVLMIIKQYNIYSFMSEEVTEKEVKRD